MKTTKAVLLCVAGVGMLLAVQNASAIVYDITSDHSTGGLGTAPFGTVELIQNLTTVDVTVSLASGYGFAKTGAADDQSFKFNGTGVALGDITVDAHTPTLVADTGAFNGDGTGNFVFGIWAPTQGNGGSDPFISDIVFHVSDATIADLTVPNNLGILFVADLINLTSGVTGPADVTPGTPSRLPDGGSTLVLLGAALAGLGSWRKLVKK